jgi:competence protein ComEA
MHELFSRRITIAVASLAVALLGVCAALPTAAATGSGKGSGGAIEPIDINKAGAGELMTIPGIGKVMAQRIIDFRKEHGPFNRVEDLLKVKGIGEKSLDKLRPYVKVGKKG